MAEKDDERTNQQAHLDHHDPQEKVFVHQRLKALRIRCIRTGTLKGFAT